MQTDRLFYEYFQIAPHALFELLQVEPPCLYRFESVVIKTSEKRLDGLLEPTELGYPYYFVEFQGYWDASIYWRGVHQIGWYHETRPQLNGQMWQLILFFLDKDHDPGPQTLGPMYQESLPWLRRYVLPDLLRQVKQPSPVLNVLRPLIATDEMQIIREGSHWTDEIRHLPEDHGTQERLLALLAQFVGQKFSHLSRQEIDQMLQLTPFEQTVAGREWLEEGRRDGYLMVITSQIEKKYGIPAVRVAQQVISFTRDDLSDLAFFILEARSYAEIEAWIKERVASKN
jgi:predicted transposase YdaD